MNCCERRCAWREHGQAIRPPILSLRLNELVRRAGVGRGGSQRLFDSASEQSKILLSIVAAMREMQIDQNASRVHRGMGDAFEQGRLVRPLRFGYRLEPFVDEEGNPVKTPKGTDGIWAFLNADRWTVPEKAPRGLRDVVVSLQRMPKYEAMLPEIIAMARPGR